MCTYIYVKYATHAASHQLVFHSTNPVSFFHISWNGKGHGEQAKPKQQGSGLPATAVNSCARAAMALVAAEAGGGRPWKSVRSGVASKVWEVSTKII